jgi:hypothetical protein
MNVLGIILLMLAVLFCIMFMHENKRFKILLMKKKLKISRHRKMLRNIEEMSRIRVVEKVIFMFSVLVRNSFLYIKTRIGYCLVLPVAFNAIFLMILMTSHGPLAVKLILLICLNLLIFKGLYETTRYLFKKDIHKFIVLLQNETNKGNEIMTSAKTAMAKAQRSAFLLEFEIVVNEIIKNQKYAGYNDFKEYSRTTAGFEMPLLISFLANAVVSGNSGIIKKNLGKIERYCAMTLECFKERFFSKIPYIGIILILPLFLIWMDSFGADIMFSGAIVQEPKEYIYMFSTLIAYTFLNL